MKFEKIDGIKVNISNTEYMAWTDVISCLDMADVQKKIDVVLNKHPNWTVTRCNFSYNNGMMMGDIFFSIPNRMVYAIDVHWDMAKCFMVEAKSREEAEKIVEDEMKKKFVSRPISEIDPIKEGFEPMVDYEVSYAGEGETEDEIEYC